MFDKRRIQQGWQMDIRSNNPKTNLNGVLSVSFYSQHGVIIVFSSVPLFDNNWHHVAFTYGGKGRASDINIYIDGKKDTKKDIAFDALNNNSFSNPDSHVEIGKQETGVPGKVGENYFCGSIDELRIWDGVRSDNDIKANFNRELKGNEPSLIGYYQFNQGTANDINKGETILKELTPNHHQGTLYGFTLCDGNCVKPDLTNSFIPSGYSVLDNDIC